MAGPVRTADADSHAPGPGGALGPYERWMLAIGKRYDLPDLMLEGSPYLSAVAELDHPQPPPAPGPDLAGGRVRLPLLWRRAGFRSRFVPLVLGADAQGVPLLDKDLPEAMADLDALAPDLAAGLGAKAGLRLNFPLQSGLMAASPVAPPAPASRDPALAGRAPKVILAIIDHGIPFAHAAFRQADTQGTRIDWCWSQGAPALPGSTTLFGREFRRDQIDAALARNRGCEDGVYHEAGLLSRAGGPPMPLSCMASHGAHCLDLMAGNWPQATAPEARIIAVDLPSSPVWETSGFGKDMFLLSAMHYIFDRADRLRDLYGTPDLPLVINLSYGHSGGAQDGNSLIEAALSEMVAARNALAPTVLVLPAGNVFQERLFVHVTDQQLPTPVTPNGPRQTQVQWLAPPDDRTSSFLEIWYPPGWQAGDILVDLSPPEGGVIATTSGLNPVGDGFAACDISLSGKVVGQLSLDRPRKGRWRAMICLAPTESYAAVSRLIHDGKAHGPAPAGAWTLTLRLPAGRTLPEVVPGQQGMGGIQLRLQRDTSYGQGQTGARQSRFLDPADQPFAPQGHPTREDRAPNALLRRFGSLNGMAGTAGALIVAGQTAGQGRAADYSACGFPLAAGPGARVHLSAISEESPALPGRRAAGTRTGVTFRASGTSSASPVVARALAESLIGSPLPAGVSLAQVVSRLAGLPQSQPITPVAATTRSGDVLLKA